MRIAVINGPNLNLLGTRETSVYGEFTLQQLEDELVTAFPQASFSFYQSNIEGELVDFIQSCNAQAIIINAGAYTHTSVAIADALKAVRIPYAEVHISNVYARETYRHQSFMASSAVGVITGFGKHSYLLAARYFLG